MLAETDEVNEKLFNKFSEEFWIIYDERFSKVYIKREFDQKSREKHQKLL
jgi:hypothetical protein